MNCFGQPPDGHPDKNREGDPTGGGELYGVSAYVQIRLRQQKIAD